MSASKRTPIEVIECPVELNYNISAGVARTVFLRGIKQGKLIGQRSPLTGMVTIPSRGPCPQSGLENVEEVVLPDTGIVKSFTVVHLPIANSALKPPSIVANVLLDGADQHFIHLVGGCKNEDVHIGMRVKAVWKDQSEWGYTLDNIAYFTPSGEPDVDIEVLQASRLAEASRYMQAKEETQ